MMRRERGITLAESLVVLGLLGAVLAVAVPNLFHLRRTVDLRRLGRQIVWDTRDCRIAALTSARKVGLIFALEADKWFYCIVEDRDGDGVSRRDYLAGVDRAISPKRWVEFLSGGTRLGVPSGWNVPDPSGRGTLPPDDGLRIGDAAIISFSPQAHATPASVYFNDGHLRMLAVRISGIDGRVRLLEWHRGWRRWQEVHY
jgi:type II secretory pathway pseudopilin PulG